MRDTNMIFISKRTLGQMFWERPERAHQILQKILPPRNMRSSKVCCSSDKKMVQRFGFVFFLHKIMIMSKSISWASPYTLKTEFVLNEHLTDLTFKFNISSII